MASGRFDRGRYEYRPRRPPKDTGEWLEAVQPEEKCSYRRTVDFFRLITVHGRIKRDSAFVYGLTKQELVIIRHGCYICLSDFCAQRIPSENGVLTVSYQFRISYELYRIQIKVRGYAFYVSKVPFPPPAPRRKVGLQRHLLEEDHGLSHSSHYSVSALLFLSGRFHPHSESSESDKWTKLPSAG